MRDIINNKQDYIAKGIGQVIINGNIFTGYTKYTSLWEKSYVKSPERSGNGSIGNLNSYTTFVTPHVKFEYDLMPIDMYRKLMDIIDSNNEVTATFYDVQNNRITTQKMYFATEEMPTLFTEVIPNYDGENDVSVEGVQNYTVELIGTNTNVETMNVVYNLNAPSGTSTVTNIGSFETQNGGDFIVGSGVDYDYKEETFDGQYAFKGVWNTKPDGSGRTYIDGNAETISVSTITDDENSNVKTLVLYAQWEASTTYTLTYAYGLGTPRYNERNEEIVSKSIQVGDTYGLADGHLPNSLQAPSVMYEQQTYYPYYNGGWYTTPVKGANSVALTDSDTYNIQGNSTIYQLYDVHKYSVTFDSQGGTEFATLSGDNAVEYGSRIALPTPIKDGYTFGGWKLGDKAFNGIMPPMNITLTAVWSAK